MPLWGVFFGPASAADLARCQPSVSAHTSRSLTGGTSSRLSYYVPVRCITATQTAACTHEYDIAQRQLGETGGCFIYDVPDRSVTAIQIATYIHDVVEELQFVGPMVLVE